MFLFSSVYFCAWSVLVFAAVPLLLFFLVFMFLLPFGGETVSEYMVVCCNVIWLASVMRLLLVWFICAINRFRVGCARL